MKGLVPGLLMLAAFALLAGGVHIIRSGDRKRGILMLVTAAVFVANVLIMSL